jgi:multicomponent Na+:H+ antiporter subunit A
MAGGRQQPAVEVHPFVRIAPLVPLALLIWFASAIPAVVRGRFPVLSLPWAPSLGTTLSFRIDGLALLFALLITGIGVLVTAFAARYMAGRPGLGRFQLFLLLFMGSMLGLTTADNVILLFVFWELTSLTSFLLIGFESERREAREAALKALLVTAGGGLVLLAGLVLLGMAGGSYEISEIGAVTRRCRSTSGYPRRWKRPRR